MIRIDRTRAQAPTKLQTQGQAALAQVIRPLAQSTPPTLQSEHFDTKIYGTAEIKKALWHMQHGKCCFCERQLEVAFATVEHFRPKTQARDQRNAPPRPGYWWLAYEFQNFYLCCSNCNTPKNDLFPLAPNAPAIPPELHPWNINPPEQSLMIDPGYDNPDTHIDWVIVPGKGPMPIHKDERGRRTIEAIKLDQRDELNAFRADHYQRFIVPLIARYKRARTQNKPTDIKLTQDDARRLIEPPAHFVGMTRAILRREGLI